MDQNDPPGRFNYLWEAFEANDGSGVSETVTDARPVPWYRTAQAITAIGAIAVAVIAMVVSAVFLVSGQSRSPTAVVEPTTPTTSSTAVPSATSTTPPATVPSAAVTTTAPLTETAPVIRAPSVESSTKKEPEIGVTRTPATRSQISVRPTPRPAHPNY